MDRPSANVVILSTIALHKGNSAGSSRMSKFADAIALYSSVYLFSYVPKCRIGETNIVEVRKNIFANTCQPKKSRLAKLLSPIFLLQFLRSVIKYTEEKKESTVFYLYPSTRPALDYLVVLYLIWFKSKTVYYEANEIRRFIPKLQKRVSFFKHPLTYINKYRSLIKYSLSEKLTRYFSGLVCISTSIEAYFKKYNTNTIRIPILTEYQEKENQPSLNYNSNEVFKICFGGMVSVKKENLLVFIDVLGKVNLKSPDFQMSFYGQVSNIDQKLLENRADKYNISDKLFFKKAVQQKELIQVYQQHHLLVLPRGYNLQNHYGFSTKMTEYLESGVPCLVTNVSDNGLFIKDSVNGFIVEPDKPDAMVDKIIHIISTYSKVAGSISKNALNTVKHELNYKVHAEKLYHFLIEKNVS